MSTGNGARRMRAHRCPELTSVSGGAHPFNKVEGSIVFGPNKKHRHHVYLFHERIFKKHDNNIVHKDLQEKC